MPNHVLYVVWLREALRASPNAPKRCQHAGKTWNPHAKENKEYKPQWLSALASVVHVFRSHLNYAGDRLDLVMNSDLLSMDALW